MDSKTVSFKVNDLNVVLKIIRMKGSCFLWIGNKTNTLDELSLAVIVSNTKESCVTRIMGDKMTEGSNSVAVYLSKKLKVPVFVSYNLSDDQQTIKAVTAAINGLLKEKIHYFC